MHPAVRICHGFVWIIKLKADRSWYTHLACFPDAVDKHGNPNPEHPSVLKYIKERL